LENCKAQNYTKPIPVGGRANALVCGRSFARIAGSNHFGTWMSVSRVCCVLSGRDPCFGLIPCPDVCCCYWCVWLWSINQEN